MGDFLTKAFEAASKIPHTIQQVIDYTGYLMFMTMADKDFLRLNHIDTKNRPITKAATSLYEFSRRTALNNISDKMDDLFTNPHNSPKANLKDLLKEAAGAALPFAAKGNLTYPLLVCAAITSCAVAAYTMQTGHLPLPIADLIAHFTGSGAQDKFTGSDNHFDDFSPF